MNWAKNNIRADIDDRDETVGKKIRESETEWVRYTIVIGDKEIHSQKADRTRQK